jgi:hypothetical protein
LFTSLLRGATGDLRLKASARFTAGGIVVAEDIATVLPRKASSPLAVLSPTVVLPSGKRQAETNQIANFLRDSLQA